MSRYHRLVSFYGDPLLLYPSKPCGQHTSWPIICCPLTTVSPKKMTKLLNVKVSFAPLISTDGTAATAHLSTMCKLLTFLRSYSMASVAGTTSYNTISATSVVTPCQPSNAAARRTEAMHELLSSERKYACDLALVCGLHIPLAQGK